MALVESTFLKLLNCPFVMNENMLSVQIFKVLLSVHMCCFDKRFALFVLSVAFQALLLILNLKFK
jgi:hypothetical protein